MTVLETLRPISSKHLNVHVRCVSAAFCTGTPWCRPSLGDKAMVSKAFTSEDVQTFADITGDTNPVHLDEEYVKTSTRFSRPVVHGTLTLGLISGVIASKLPGPGSVLLSQEVEYPGALYVNEEVTAQVELVELKRRIAVLRLLCHTVDERVVLKGTVRVLVAKEFGSTQEDQSLEGGL